MIEIKTGEDSSGLIHQQDTNSKTTGRLSELNITTKTYIGEWPWDKSLQAPLVIPGFYLWGEDAKTCGRYH
jgi:hypothetical protein